MARIERSNRSTRGGGGDGGGGSVGKGGEDEIARDKRPRTFVGGGLAFSLSRH